MPFAIRNHLYNLKNVKKTHGGVHGCFSHFSKYTNGTKLRKGSYFYANSYVEHYYPFLYLLPPLNKNLFQPFMHNLLNANPTKWSNTLKQFVSKFPRNCLSMFDHFWGCRVKD